MKLIVTFILSLFIAVTPALAATPNATLRLDPLRRFAYINFTQLKGVSRISYVLVYDTATGQKGVEGGYKVNSKSRSASRRQILGTCSASKCVYHKGVRNSHLDVTFTLRSGGTINVTKTLP